MNQNSQELFQPTNDLFSKPNSQTIDNDESDSLAKSIVSAKKENFRIQIRKTANKELLNSKRFKRPQKVNTQNSNSLQQDQDLLMNLLGYLNSGDVKMDQLELIMGELAPTQNTKIYEELDENNNLYDHIKRIIMQTEGDLQMYALEIMSDITYYQAIYENLGKDYDFIYKLIKLTVSENMNNRHFSMNILSNSICDDNINEDLVLLLLKSDLVDNAIEEVKVNFNQKLLEDYSILVYNLSRSEVEDFNFFTPVKTLAILCMEKCSKCMISPNDLREIIQNCCECANNCLRKSEEDELAAYLEQGNIDALITIGECIDTYHKDEDIEMLKLLLKVLTSYYVDNTMCIEIINCGLSEYICELAKSKNKYIVRMGLDSIYDLLNQDSSEVIEAFFNCEGQYNNLAIVKHIIQLCFDPHGKWNAKQEAFGVMSVIISAGNNLHNKICCEQGFLQTIIENLKCETAADIILPVIDCLESLFFYGVTDMELENNSVNKIFEDFNKNGGESVLEELQQHESDEVYNKIYSLIDKYYKVE